MNKSIDSTFSNNALRVKNRITCEKGSVESFAKIAKKIAIAGDDIPVDTLKRIFNSKRSPKLSEAYLIAEALNTTLGSLSNSKDQGRLKTTINRWILINEERAKHTAAMSKSLEKMADCDLRAEQLWKKFQETWR